MTDSPHSLRQGLPTGTVTFLFTDIEGSTNLLQRLGDRLYSSVLSDQRMILRAAFQEGGGSEIDTQGDAFFVAFARARDAVATAVAAQRAIAAHPWPEGASMRVRMGLHTGEPISASGGYVGLDVHKAARISSSGHGGQVLLSQTTRDLVKDDLPEGAGLKALGSHRLKDLARPEEVFQLLHPDLPSNFPPLKSLNTLPNNLPIQLTRFIGREKEIAEVKRRLAEARLLTLTGSGGCGKTRLALQVAADLLVGAHGHAPLLPDGAYLVELASLSDPSLVPQAVASALGVREGAVGLSPGEGGPGAMPGTSGGRSMLDKLLDYLQSKQLLLVLDNCEHLIAACAHLTEALLRGCPNLKVLAASRESLGIAGEASYRVPSLSLPDPKSPPVGVDTISALTMYEAVRLFIDRAVDALSTFAVTNQNAPAVVQICHRLDGIPLAIELAAARVKVLSAEQIARRLDDSFRLLTGGSRTALPRQQTLRAAIDWSYNLLSEPERILFRRLSVFMGGWTIEAAEAICADTLPPAPRSRGAVPRGRGTGGQEGAVREDDVLDLLTHLVDKSLVVMEEKGGEARYRFLETIRQYARDKLMESGEGVDLRVRHQDWFLELVEQAEPELHGPDQVAWFDRLEAEHDNLRAALEWSLGGEETDVGLRLSGALWWFWWVRGYLSEGRGWLERALSGSSSASASARAKALCGTGALACYQGDFAVARSRLEESVAIGRESGDKQEVAWSLTHLGYVAQHQANHGWAIALCEESLALFRELGDKRGISTSLTHLGLVALRQGNYGRAMTLCEESLSLLRELGDKWGTARSLNLSGLVALRRGDYGRAVALCEKSLTLHRELGNKWGIAMSLGHLGLSACHQGEYGRAMMLLKEGLVLFRELGDKWGIARLLNFSGLVALRQEDHGRAMALCKEGLALSWELREKLDIAMCLEGLAHVAGAEGQPERVVRLYGAAEVLREAIDTPLPTSDRADYDRSVSAARAELGEETFAKAWEEGRKMMMEEAIAYALGSPADEVGGLGTAPRERG
jgi:predicted ATPase/class 3 adenylate cyclase